MRLATYIRTAVLGLACAATLPLAAQQPDAVLNDAQAKALYQRSLQLMESSGFAMPELARAGAPLMENMRQTLESLDFLGYRSAQLHYKMIDQPEGVSDGLGRGAEAGAVPRGVPEATHRTARPSASLEVYFQSLVEQLQRSLRDPDRDNLRRYAEANQTLPAPAKDKPRVVFYGDSITDGWRLNEYFPDRDFVNRGISGQITGQMLGRFQNDVVALNPAAVLILAGTNDIARGVPPSAIQANFTMMADLADAHKVKPIFASILPVSDYHKGVNPSYERTPMRPPAVIQAMNAWLKDFCVRRNYVYLDYFTGLADQGGQLKADYADDGLHPNPAGYRVMAPLALAAIEKAVHPQPEKKKRRLF
jgi:lysophospholipase L1-like esterase